MRTFLCAFILTSALSSCCNQKTYTCVCAGRFVGSPSKTEIKAKNRDEAEKQCSSMTTPPYVDGRVCSLQ